MGSKVNFLVLTYVVALVMWDQELFTESKNLYLLPRYEVSKLGRLDPFSRIFPKMYRKLGTKKRLFETVFLSSFGVKGLETQFSGYR